MEREETKKILMIIDATYPNFKVENPVETIDAWHFFLQDYEYNDIALALKMFVNTSTKGFAPSVSELIAMIHRPEQLSQMSELEAWTLVRSAIGKANYYAAEEFEKLPPLVQQAVGSPSQLRNWAMGDIDTIETVVASNFQRTYRSKLATKMEMDKLPAEVRNRIESLQQKALEVKK